MSTTLIVVLILAVLAVLIVGFLLMRGGADGVYTPGEMTDSVVADLPETQAPPEPAPAAPEAAAAPAGGPADELTRIKGLGPKASARLNDIGVVRFEQIAAWSESDISAVANRLGPGFEDRIARDRWVEQAGLLARGDSEAFEAKFGKLG